MGGAPPASPPAIPPLPRPLLVSHPPLFSPLLPDPVPFPREGVFALSVSHHSFNPPGWGRKVYFLPSPPCNCLRKNQNQPKTPISQSTPEASGQRQPTPRPVPPPPRPPPRPRPASTSLSQRCPAAGTRDGIYLGHQPAPPSAPYGLPHPTNRTHGGGGVSRQGCHSCPSPTRPCPPRSREGQRARRCRDPRRCLLAGVPPSPLPGGCSPPEGGGERQAGAEAGLGRPLPLTFRPPPPLSVPSVPARGGVRTPGGSRLGALHRRARGRAGFEGGCEAPCRETPPLPPTPAVPSRPAAEAVPQKQMRGGGGSSLT